MIQSISPNRAILYILCASLLLPLYFLWDLFSITSEKSELHGLIEQTRTDVLVRERKQALNLAVRDHFKQADHFYIDKHLETLTLLEPEIEALHKVLDKADYAHDELTRKRYHFLTSDQNHLSFVEGVVHSTPFFQEVTETLSHPVEVNGSDIKRLLGLIEGNQGLDPKIALQRPQLIITDFRLDRKAIHERNEIFLINLKLVKREFSP